MPHFLRANLLLALLALTAAFSSCTKKTDDPVPPAPTTGGLAGTVSPADALTAVTATDGGGLTFVARPAPGTGAFALADLKPGTYTLSFAPASGYAAPAPRTIQVVAGQTAAAGTVVVVGDGTPRGTISWTVDGVAFSSTTLSGVIRPQGSATEFAATATVGGVQHEVDFYFSDYIPGLGSYQLYANGPGYNAGGYSRTTGGVRANYGTYLLQTGPTSGGVGQGTFTVSAYNAAARTLSGTFAFTAVGPNGPGGFATVNITNGSFNLQY